MTFHTYTAVMFKQIIYSPIWLFELVTSAKSFRNNPIIGSYWLNRMGLHVIRLVVGHLIMYLRMWLLSRGISSEDRQAFMRDGFLIKKNFLSKADLVEVKQEFSSFEGETREAWQGDTITRRAVLEPDALINTPVLSSMLRSTSFQRLSSYTAGHLRAPLLYFETVKNQFVEDDLEGKELLKDPQKYFHSDTFHPTMKLWFFMNEVKPEHGPFTYIPGSHKLTWARIKWEYKQSLVAKDFENGMAANGSFRFSPDDFQELGFVEPVSLTVDENTLVFANTYGVHRRGDAEGKATRSAIWGDSRTNPFLPFPGIPGEWVNALQYKFLADFRRRADLRAAKVGRRSPWKIVD